jgi:hypothetical protein
LGKSVEKRDLADGSTQWGMDIDGEFESVITFDKGFYTVDTGNNGSVKVPDSNNTGGGVLAQMEIPSHLVKTIEAVGTQTAQAPTLTPTESGNSEPPIGDDPPKQPTEVVPTPTSTAEATPEATATEEVKKVEAFRGFGTSPKEVLDNPDIFVIPLEKIYDGSYEKGLREYLEDTLKLLRKLLCRLVIGID